MSAGYSSGIDSTLNAPQSPATTAATTAPLRTALVFDACNASVVLRAVLFVQVVVATAALYGADSMGEWLLTMATLTAGSLPGTLVWLITACSLKHQLQRLSIRSQYLAGVVFGVVAGLYACGTLHFTGMGHAHWLASGVTGGGLGARGALAIVSSSRLSSALKTVWHCPQRTLPARAFNCSGVTRKVVWQFGQRVFIVTV